MERKRLLPVLIIVFLLWTVMSAFGDEKHHILYLDSYNYGYEWSDGVSTGIRQVFHGMEEVVLITEHLDTKNYPLHIIEDATLELFKAKYLNRDLAAVILSDDNAFNFALSYREELFPGIPLIFLGLNNFTPQMIEGIGEIYGLEDTADSRSVLELIFSLHSHVKEIYIIHDQTVTGLESRARIEKEIASCTTEPPGCEYRFFTGLTANGLRDTVGRLSPASVIIALSHVVDADGHLMDSEEYFSILDSSDRPIYVINDYGMFTDIPVGGYIRSSHEVGRLAAELTLTVISGEADRQIYSSGSSYVFNEAALEKHGISTSDLPEGSKVISKPTMISPRLISLVVVLILIIAGLMIVVYIIQRLRKQSRQRLELLQIVLDNSPIPIIATGPLKSDTVIFANAIFCRAMRKDPEEILGLSNEELDQLVSSYIGEGNFRTFDKEVLEKQETIHQPEVIFTDKEGNERHFSITKSPFIWEKKPAVISTILDMTDQYDAQEAARHAEKMQVIGQLAGGVAHDFNNQIMAILGYADLMNSEITDEMHKEYLRYIMIAAENSKALTERLLAFSRKDVSKMALFDISQSVENVIGLLSHTIDRRIKIRRSLDSSNNACFGDQNLIENALLNIGINAADAITEQGTITYRVSSDETTVTIAVEDTGEGIPEEIRERIFEPFFTTKERGAGTGMGLPSVKQTVERHYGLITVSSIMGEGTTFTIKLPKNIVEDFEPILEPASVPLKKPVKSSRILVIDDEKAIRFLLQKMLEKQGYIVDTAADGEDALKVFASDTYDVVLLDMIMPKMDGYTAFIEMQKIDPHVKVIMVSAFAENDQVEQLRKLGLHAFVKKPVDSQTLIPIIRGVLSEDET